jgi:hypothetical protein
MEKVLLAAMGSEESNDAREHTLFFTEHASRFERHGSFPTNNGSHGMPLFAG